jgi:peptidoglycan/LPS O-acetylase OafA/YrhL
VTAAERWRGPAAPAARFRRLAARVDAATPPDRDRTVDALRALAIAGVIGGHWLVTALVPTSAGHGTVLREASPLAWMPGLAPVSWVFQTLSVFFLVGGYSAACGGRGGRGGYARWLRRRLVRLARPVAVLAAVWIPVTACLCLAGVPGATVRTLLTLVISPLWFLGVYAGLTALTPAARWLVRRFGAMAAAFPAAVVAAADLVRFGLHGPAWVGWLNLPAGWLVPYLIGVAWALGSLRGRGVPAAMLAGGTAATAALITWAGYPASMVGVNGAAISNLNPPTLAAVTFGIAQCGFALLLRGRLARWMRRPAAWAAVATVNLSAMTLFLWHQTAFIAVSSAGLPAGQVPGLLTAPAHVAWVAERIGWLPAFAAALAGLWLGFRQFEHGGSGQPPMRIPAPESPDGEVTTLLKAGDQPGVDRHPARWPPSSRVKGVLASITRGVPSRPEHRPATR